MADQQHPQPLLRAQFIKQVHDLGAQGSIKRAGRFIGDQQFWIMGDGSGDHHPLTFPAG